MKFRFLRYGLFLSIPVTVWISLNSEGWLCWLPIIWSFGFIPLVETIEKPDHSNLNEKWMKSLAQDKKFDYWLILSAFIHFSLLFFFLYELQNTGQDFNTSLGRTFGIGLMMGNYGINVAHELGHRKTKLHKTLSQILLLSAQYMHFHIEHNNGHHLKVATLDDPATARYRESLYAFWLRSIIRGWISAYQIERKLGKRFFQNTVIHYFLAQIVLILGVYLLFPLALPFYLLSAMLGILLLETINYIEHYGLMRKKISDTSYEKVKAWHSWNSDHILGRALLFELSRHSDHHYAPQRKYQVLRHQEEAPQLPYGYPAMMVIALIPPIYFRIMNRELKKIKTLHS